MKFSVPTREKGQADLPETVTSCDSGAMGTITRPPGWQTDTSTASSGAGWKSALSPRAAVMAAAILAPIAVAAALIPWRARLDTSDNALILVVVIVAVASTGRRMAAFVAALVSALSFDFFLTRPYYSLRITREQDLITEILLLVVGIAVGELAARGRRHRDAASQGRHDVAVLHGMTELAASGRDPREVASAAERELRDLLFLRDCDFTLQDPTDVTARLTPDGTVKVGEEVWPTDRIGLPSRSVDLPVRSGGWLVGHFILTPTPGQPVARDRLLVAVALADQVGAAMAADEMRGAV
jgi:K+-sensing histidine kinase KdpD